ncbi:hypothetical protein CU633_19710 [Bacillus sp. V3-13]|nr:hypothetical protein CU633_19710 [Bacillus sp. V3-13]
MSKLLGVFFIAISVAAAGVYTGQFVPAALFLPLVICEIVLLLIVTFTRKKVSYPVMYAFMFISGVTLYASLSFYVSEIGAGETMKGILLGTAAFAGLAVFGLKTKEDFSFLGGFLSMSVFALIGLAILQIFMPFSGTAEMIYAGFGVLIFTGFTIYDFNKIKMRGFSDQEIPRLVISIYLDFINLILFILRFLRSSK